MKLEIKTQAPSAQARILSLAGEVDVSTSPQLKQEIVRHIGEGVTLIVLDMSQLSYMDSTGLGVLVGCLKRLRENEGNLIIVGLGQRTKRVFEITGLLKIFANYNDLAEAAQMEGLSL